MQLRYPSRLLPWFAVLGLALTGGVLLPVGSYLIGKRLIGAYGGKLGLTDYLVSIYAAAGRGELLAWWLLLAPALVASVWYGLLRFGPRHREPPDE